MVRLALGALLLLGCGGASERPPEDQRGLRAERALAKGELPRALALFTELAEDPSIPSQDRDLARFRQAEVLERQERLEEARVLYRLLAEGRSYERAARAA